jgi:DNA repair protein RecO (recombination protein O)
VNLAYVSPKSAQAVSIEAGEKFAHKLLRLPDFLKNNDQEKIIEIDNHNLLDGLSLSGYFLHKNLATINNNIKANPSLSNNFYRENIIKILKTN